MVNQDFFILASANKLVRRFHGKVMLQGANNFLLSLPGNRSKDYRTWLHATFYLVSTRGISNASWALIKASILFSAWK
jgi:hypothetical protein